MVNVEIFSTASLGVMKKSVWFAFGFFGLFMLIALPARYWLRESRAASTYEHATLEQNEAQIIAKAGAPDEVLKCGEYLWWNGDQANPPKNDGRCVKWVRYNFFLHTFAFGYSADGRLVSRYEYFSE